MIAPAPSYDVTRDHRVHYWLPALGSALPTADQLRVSYNCAATACKSRTVRRKIDLLSIPALHIYVGKVREIHDSSFLCLRCRIFFTFPNDEVDLMHVLIRVFISKAATKENFPKEGDIEKEDAPPLLPKPQFLPPFPARLHLYAPLQITSPPHHVPPIPCRDATSILHLSPSLPSSLQLPRRQL
jgi:hypothetical protein